MQTLKELEKDCQKIDIMKVNDNDVNNSDDIKLSAKKKGEKILLRLDRAYPVRYLAIKFKDGDKIQYGLRCHSRDFLSSKNDGYEVFDLENFTGKTVELISKGNTADDKDKSNNLDIEDIKLLVPNEFLDKKQEANKQLAEKAGGDLKNVKDIDIKSVVSLEADEGAENAITQNKEFTSNGRGRVLRFDLGAKYVISEVSAKTKQDSQLIGLNGKTYEFSKDKPLLINNDVFVSNAVDMILEGGSKTTKNSIHNVILRGEKSK